MKEQVFATALSSPFSWTSLLMLLTLRYIQELSVQEEFLFCHPLPARTTAEEIFKALNDFIQESHIDGAAVVKYALMAQDQ